MSRRRKLPEEDGDRSHIPREERSYVEYHPRLLTHLALTIVRQATDHHRRASSRIDRDHLPQLDNNKSPATNGHAKFDYASRRTSTTTSSVPSRDGADSRRDDLYALGQIITPENVEPVLNGDYSERPGNLFEEVSEAGSDDGKGTTSPADSNLAIDPALLADYDELASPIPARYSIANSPQGNGAIASQTSTRKSSSADLAPRTALTDAANGNKHGHARPNLSRSGTVGTSDRFLRSEVSVEEKYERLRREEGFSIGKLNVPSFRRLDESIERHKVKLSSNAIAFGYQPERLYESSSEAYTRTIELPETDLADRVEYDMDEQDDYWLTQYNQLRVARDGDIISREIFEITLTKIEKEWTALEKRIPRVEKKEEAPSEDAKCAICDDGECENTNAIVFCDGCNLAVHQACYGVPYIPEGQWLCRKCFASPVDPVSCVFCPSKQGAFKQTSDLHWAHLLCTSWIPEVNVGNLVFMEPIEGVSNIPASRWKLVCYICKLRVGACIQCSNKSCYTPFHVSCARQAKLFLQRDLSNANSIPKSFCDKHCPDWYREMVNVKSSLLEAQRYFAARTDPQTQSPFGAGEDVQRRGQFVISLKRSKQNAVIPALVFAEILKYMQKFRIRNKADFIADLCKYWSLKRRSRRGVSLLKRLQVQIEDSAMQRTGDKQKSEKLQFCKVLLKELDDHHRPILDELMERETVKKERCELRDAVIERIYLPMQSILKDLIAGIQKYDSNNALPHMSLTAKHMLNTAQDIDWDVIVSNVDNGHYMDIASFEADYNNMRRNILEAFPEASTKEHRLVNRLDNHQHTILARAKMQESAMQLGIVNKTATAYNDDFEPEGLGLLEERPFNWAIRDASPLSDLDDEALADFESAANLPFVPIVTPSIARTTSTVKVDDNKLNTRALVPGQAERSKDKTLVQDDPADAKDAKACSVCKSRKVRCDGRDRACRKSPRNLKYFMAQEDDDEIATPLKSSPPQDAVPDIQRTPVESLSHSTPKTRSLRGSNLMAQGVLPKSVEDVSSKRQQPSQIDLDSPRISRSASAKEQEISSPLKRKRDQSSLPVGDSPSSAVRSRRRL